MPEAVRDLEDIYEYVSEHNPSAAERLRQNLVQEVKILSSFWQAGRMVPEVGDPHIHELIRPPYRIIYRILEREQQIHILRFWHGARDTPEITL